MTALELAKQTVKILDSKKAEEIKLIKIADISVLADYFVIATGTSSTHVNSLADEVEFKLEEQGIKVRHKEGYHSNSWILLDYGNVVVHVFTPESRSFYDLDRLWRDGQDIDVSEILK
jgi:ribosome-associated protein